MHLNDELEKVMKRAINRETAHFRFHQMKLRFNENKRNSEIDDSDLFEEWK